jgi:hypothetical protein
MLYAAAEALMVERKSENGRGVVEIEIETTHH